MCKINLLNYSHKLFPADPIYSRFFNTYIYAFKVGSNGLQFVFLLISHAPLLQHYLIKKTVSKNQNDKSQTWIYLVTYLFIYLFITFIACPSYLKVPLQGSLKMKQQVFFVGIPISRTSPLR